MNKPTLAFIDQVGGPDVVLQWDLGQGKANSKNIGYIYQNNGVWLFTANLVTNSNYFNDVEGWVLEGIAEKLKDLNTPVVRPVIRFEYVEIRGMWNVFLDYHHTSFLGVILKPSGDTQYYFQSETGVRLSEHTLKEVGNKVEVLNNS